MHTASAVNGPSCSMSPLGALKGPFNFNQSCNVAASMQASSATSSSVRVGVSITPRGYANQNQLAVMTITILHGNITRGFVRVVDEFIKMHARICAHFEIAIVFELQIHLTALPGADRLLRVHVRTT